MHPSHEDQLLRLKKVEGQVRGIQTMIEERRYCMDLLSQIRAVTGALRKIESAILEIISLVCNDECRFSIVIL